jgi:hypothetical protein
MYGTCRPIAILLAAVALLLSAVPAMAAEPPADVAFDGTVTVTFTDPHVGALADADVALVASRPDLGEDAVVQELGGETDADGRIVFTGVARPSDGAPSVVLDATAVLERPNGCGGSIRFVGGATAEAAIEVTIAVEAEGVSSSCRAFPVRGTVLDPDGEPFAVASASATVTYPDGETENPEVTVEPDGVFRFMARGWLGDGVASATLEVSGEATTVDDPDTGCKQLVALVATDTWELHSSTEAPPTHALVAERVVLSEACGSQGTPAPPAAPTVTLPPTDTKDGVGAQDEDGLGAGVLMLVAIGLSAMVAARRRVSPRGN